MMLNSKATHTAEENSNEFTIFDKYQLPPEYFQEYIFSKYSGSRKMIYMRIYSEFLIRTSELIDNPTEDTVVSLEIDYETASGTSTIENLHIADSYFRFSISVHII